MVAAGFSGAFGAVVGVEFDGVFVFSFLLGLFGVLWSGDVPALVGVETLEMGCSVFDCCASADSFCSPLSFVWSEAKVDDCVSGSLASTAFFPQEVNRTATRSIATRTENTLFILHPSFVFLM